MMHDAYECERRREVLNVGMLNFNTLYNRTKNLCQFRSQHK